MARRRVVEETETLNVGEKSDAAARQEEEYDREERKSIEDETLNRRTEEKSEEKPVGRRRVISEDSKPSPASPSPGEDAVPRVTPSPAEYSKRLNESPDSSEGDTVRVVWAEEAFSPQQFHSFRVGPFEATTRVESGETISMAADRAMRELRLWAEAERDRKKASYLKMVESTTKR